MSPTRPNATTRVARKPQRLERYNQVLWAIVGTVAAIGIGLGVVGTACATVGYIASPHGLHAIGALRGPAEQQPSALVYESPLISPYSDYFMIPVGVEPVSGRAANLISSSYDSGNPRTFKAFSIYYGLSWPTCSNVVFVHRATGKASVLLDRRAVITQLYYPYEEALKSDRSAKMPKVLLLGLVDADTNGDGRMNEDDAVTGYLADLAGQHLTPITPPGTQLLDWEFDERSASVIARVRIDSQHVTLLRIDLDKPAVGTPLIPDEVHQVLGALLEP